MPLHIVRALMIAVAVLLSGSAFAAIAPSKLGRFIDQVWSTTDASSDHALLRSLRQAGLVRRDVPDDKLLAVFQKARQEHEHLSMLNRKFNSPNERVRVFLEPYLTDKGRKWAVPTESLYLPDD